MLVSVAALPFVWIGQDILIERRPDPWSIFRGGGIRCRIFWDAFDKLFARLFSQKIAQLLLLRKRTAETYEEGEMTTFLDRREYRKLIGKGRQSSACFPTTAPPFLKPNPPPSRPSLPSCTGSFPPVFFQETPQTHSGRCRESLIPQHQHHRHYHYHHHHHHQHHHHYHHQYHRHHQNHHHQQQQQQTRCIKALSGSDQHKMSSKVLAYRSACDYCHSKQVTTHKRAMSRQSSSSAASATDSFELKTSVNRP